MHIANSHRATTGSQESDRPWDEIAADFDLHPDMMTDDREELLRLKEAIARLSEPDRRIIVLYAELGSLRQLARRLGVSRGTAHGRVKAIQAQIKADLLRRTLAEEVARL